MLRATLQTYNQTTQRNTYDSEQIFVDYANNCSVQEKTKVLSGAVAAKQPLKPLEKIEDKLILYINN